MTVNPAFDPERTILSPEYRTNLLASLASGATYDLVVIGAGVTGTGVALDAASRGLRVLLVESEDFAFGTSRWSSKLAHGGLRYLATGNVGIARRSAVERGALMETIAPHLTRALPQVISVKSWDPRGFIPRLGFYAGDMLRLLARTSGKILPLSRTISAARVRELCPGVDDGTKFGFVNYDGQLIDDARLVTALARTAAGYGADILTHAKASVESGRVEGKKKITLTLTNKQEGLDNAADSGFEVTAAGVVNATGVWAGGVEGDVTVTPSRGTHIVVDAAKVGNPEGALTVPVPGSISRFCFVLPVQLDRCYIGLTDEKAPLEDVPEAPESDIQWILDVVNQGLKTKLTTDDVIGAFAGLRPLVKLRQKDEESGSGSTADLSREHLILNNDGVVTVTGGKLTEYRLMAEETIDEVVNDKDIRASISSEPEKCHTKTIALVGANDERSPHSTNAISLAHAVVTDRPPSLVSRYGAEAINVFAESALPNGTERVAGLDITRAELSYAVTHEGAVTVDDILDRRTRIGLVPRDREAALPTAIEALEAAGIKAQQ